MLEMAPVRAERVGKWRSPALLSFFLLASPLSAVEQARGVCGDSNGDGLVDLGDAVHVLTWLFQAGAPPRCGPLCCVDVNSDSRQDLSDAVRILEWLFTGSGAIDCPSQQPVVHEIGHLSLAFDGSPGSAGTMPVEVYYPAVESGQDVDVAPGRFPLVVFGHAYNHESLDYEYLWEELVPSGYIVALSDRLQDDLVLDADDFALDLHFVLSSMKAEGENRDSPFFGHVKDASALMGHSAGGGASFPAAADALAADGTDLRTVVAMAPLGVILPPVLGLREPIEAAGGLDVPVLILEGGKDCTTPSGIHSGPLFDALPDEDQSYLVTLPLGDHCGFSDENGPTTAACGLAELILCSPLFPLINLQGETLGSTEQTRVVRSLVKPWLDRHLKELPSALELFEERLRAEDITWRQR